MPHFAVSFPVVALLNLQVEADTEEEAAEDAAILVELGVMSVRGLELAASALNVDGFTLTLDCDIAADEAVVTNIFDL